MLTDRPYRLPARRRPAAEIPCALVAPSGVTHRLDEEGRTYCGRKVTGGREYVRVRDAINFEGARACRSCFSAWRAR